MTKIVIFILRALWLLWAGGWIWNLCTGQLTNPLHPLNLVNLAALWTGCVTIWFKPARYRIIAGVAGFILSAVFGVQMTLLLWMFDWSSSFTCTWGPLSFHGTAAYWALWSPLALQILCSLTLIWNTACDIDRTTGTPQARD